ncbi:ubiquinone biosynthesis protein COQ4 homolog, mitochondrial-like [Amphibalanus amphitrite]|uniref:ubiquinone biosynthesis protein COQ4 homolog, mitochondrial-like n=1 Tax=Amphibalanus amphitrite TaxID=1232801 RepID=UPI001C92B4EA|nr:ubiquinone biosynthesis protein COQ4 homolog, mitochondrial-like [Amphibalanus amphitrite]XP_043224837.1 ubiquinone biosynthesis protein COQ4 homolog, mitochondrial-like [Amphibalanus amphitrite]
MLNGRVVCLRGFRCLRSKRKCSAQHQITRLNHQDESPQHDSLGEAEDAEPNFDLYPSHVPTSFAQKVILGLGSSVVGLLDPTRADMVAVSGETTGALVLPCLLSKMQQHPEGREILKDRPIINSGTVDLAALSRLPDGTLGREYIRFLEQQKVTPDSRDPVRFVDDAEQAYVMQRYRESHDLVHTLLGMPTNLLGEVTVKWVEGLQTGLPMCVGGGLLAPLRLKPKHRQRFRTECLPWALRAGRDARFLLSVYWERRWEQPLAELRQELGVPPPPDLLRTAQKQQPATEAPSEPAPPEPAPPEPAASTH